VSWRLKEFLSQVKGLDEAAFVTRYPHPLLLSEGHGAGGASGRAEGDAPTRKLGTVEEIAAYAEDADDAWVVPVTRKETSQHPSIITVGRGEECDVRLAHPLISKKHAYFTQDAQGYNLCDADSTNGCFADGNKLEPHQPFRLSDSMALRFGPAVKYRFFGCRAFYAFCSMRLRIRTSAQSKS
jgi:hypothetical protein